MADLKTATSAVPGVLVAQYLPSTEAAQYTAAVGTTVQITSAIVANTDSSTQTVTLSIVKSGGTAGGSNRILPTITLAAGAVLDLGEQFLGEGDFISGVAGTASKVTIVMTGVVFSSTTTGAPSGIQADAVGSGGKGTATAAGTNKIGTGANRWLLASMLVQPTTTAIGWASYTGLSMSCTDGALTRLVSIDFNNGSSVIGSAHIFGRANPSSGTTQAVTGAAAAAGSTMNLVIGSKSFSGVGSVTGAVSSGPVGAAALNLPIASAVGHIPFFAAAFFAPPIDFSLRTTYFNGFTSGFTVPQWLLQADALGAATVTATTSNSTIYAAVGVDIVPA